MKCIITAGPTYEELDEVRRLTNFSTGTLGCGLADFLTRRGHQVTLLLGYYASAKPAEKGIQVQTFTTTADLRERLAKLASPKIDAVFHTAAVSDFQFGKIFQRTPSGQLRPIRSAKFSTRDTGLLAELVPAPKIIAHMRAWYPEALIAGWKYELEGTRADVVAKAEKQMRENKTDVCVINGRAYGKGFGVVRSGEKPLHQAGAEKLYTTLAGLIR